MINRIAQEVITGYFTILDVPSELVVGEDIIITVGYYAYNPGDVSFWNPWKTFVIVDSPQLGNLLRELDATREISHVAQRSHTYNLGPMPDKTVALSFFLFAHPDGSRDWDWGEYAAWLSGYSGGDIQLLNSNYRFIEPVQAPVELETLEIDITPDEGGYVTTVPSSIEGLSTWYRGTTGRFTYGTIVQVTAHPYAGYRFEKWSDEIEGGVNYSNPAEVKPMTEHRAAKAHFREIEAEVEERLEIDITPGGSGSVSVSPPPNRVDGNNYFYDYGTEVMVTAYPEAGYRFDHWSDEIVGGVNYNNPAPVKAMTETRAVKAHFREIEIPPECEVDADCPVGYICQGGICIPEEPPPDGEEPPEERKIPWGPIALVGGGVAFLIAMARPKKK